MASSANHYNYKAPGGLIIRGTTNDPATLWSPSFKNVHAQIRAGQAPATLNIDARAPIR